LGLSSDLIWNRPAAKAAFIELSYGTAEAVPYKPFLACPTNLFGCTHRFLFVTYGNREDGVIANLGKSRINP